jgi:hypothetical protein
MATTTTLTMERIDDCEGDGTCGACGREGLRWVVTLSDGSRVGLECAKKLVGFRPAPHTYNWVADYEPVAEYRDGRDVFVMWQHKTRNITRETLNGHLHSVGGVRSDWQRRGWGRDG